MITALHGSAGLRRRVPDQKVIVRSRDIRPAGLMKRLPGEFELIARLCAALPRSRRTILGPGDDCAILKPSRYPQLITIDSMAEQVHFKLQWAGPEALGARALTVNLSDIAAMGGVPTACVVNLAIRAGLGATFFDRLYAGLRRAASAAGVDIVGGNITRADRLAITIGLLGEVRGGVLRRDLARPDDEIYVTGTVGDAALGRRVLAGELKAHGSTQKFLVRRYLNPTARVEAGRKLASIRPLAAAIDLSDGLWQDLGHVLERSRVGAEVDSCKIPLSSAYRAVAGDDPEIALSGGEDYELLFCLRPGNSAAELSRRLGVKVTQIGRITAHRRTILMNWRGHKRGRTMRLAGWDQLRARA